MRPAHLQTPWLGVDPAAFWCTDATPASVVLLQLQNVRQGSPETERSWGRSNSWKVPATQRLSRRGAGAAMDHAARAQRPPAHSLSDGPLYAT